MKTIFILLNFLFCLFTSHGQIVNNTTYFITRVKLACGAKQEDNFSLVFGQDTLVNYKSTPSGWEAGLFDEKIITWVYPDSFRTEYTNYRQKSIQKFTVPDSTRSYSSTIEEGRKKEIWFNKDGNPDRERDSSGSGYSETWFLEDGTKKIEMRKDGYLVKWSTQNPDSSYTSIYRLDSTLQRYTWNIRKGHLSKNMDHWVDLHHQSYHTSYYSYDSSYDYSYNYHLKDTTRTYSFNKKYPDRDSSYGKSVSLSPEDSVYSENIRMGDSSCTSRFSRKTGLFLMERNSHVDLERVYNHQGELLYKALWKDSLKETWENRDTFYYEKRYYHHLNWKNDTDDILIFYPYYRESSLDRDSNVIKQTDFEFQPYSWPILTITTSDSSWTDVVTKETRYKYSDAGWVCQGPEMVLTGFKPGKDSLYISGWTTPEMESVFRSKLEHALKGTFSFFSNQYYLLYLPEANQAAKGFITTISMPVYVKKKLQEETNGQKLNKANVYINGKQKKIRGLLVRVSYKPRKNEVPGN